MKKLIGILLLSGLFIACSSEKSLSPDDGETQQATGVTLFESKDSQNKWLLQADKVDFEDMSRAVLTNPHLILREDGKDSTEVSGKRGILDYPNKLVRIEGNVRVHSLLENILLTSDRIFYDIDKDYVWSNSKTVVTRGSGKITAKNGIETDSKLRKIKFNKQITQLPTDLTELQGVTK